MSNYFLTKDGAAEKLESSVYSGTEYATKAECLEMGADPNLLGSYQAQDYPVDINIQPGVLVWHFRIRLIDGGLEEPLGETFGGDIVYSYIME